MKYAFPFTDSNETHPGMTLLEYFAGCALTGVSNLIDYDLILPSNKWSDSDRIELPNIIAKYCVRQAETLVKALEFEKEKPVKQFNVFASMDSQ